MRPLSPLEADAVEAMYKNRPEHNPGEHDEYSERVQDIGSRPVLAVDDTPEILPLNTHRYSYLPLCNSLINGLTRHFLVGSPRDDDHIRERSCQNPPANVGQSRTPDSIDLLSRIPDRHLSLVLFLYQW